MIKVIFVILGIILAIIICGFIIFNSLTKIQKSEPEIVNLNKSIISSGLKIRTTDKTLFKDLQKVYDNYTKLKEEKGIPNMKEPWEYISLSNNFQGIESWDYYTGHVITNQSVPTYLIKFETPKGTYAIFKLRGKNKLTFGISLGKLKQYIYTQWLPNSKYNFGGSEFEYNNKSMDEKNPYDIDLYVLIVPKESDM